jgi:hypothetical protein
LAPALLQWVRIRKGLALAAGVFAFTLVATLNSGGYRYGIGDQAFYVPAVIQHLDPNLFPRDRFILHAQDRFLFYDDAVAAAARFTGISVPVLFFISYVAGMFLLFGAIVAIGGAIYRSWWSIATLVALMTLRHRITMTGANSLEGYFHPRMLAFAVGAWALAAYLHEKRAASLGLVAAAMAIHPTTALWFAVWIAVALAVSEPRWRLRLAGAAVFGGVLATWMLTRGPLRGHLTRMDAVWASALTGKDYIFPSDWNSSFWLVNLSYLPVATVLYLGRQLRGIAVPREMGLVAGACALLLIFLISWPLMSAGFALALQLQTSRVFWMLDFLAAIYLAWILAEGFPDTAAAPDRGGDAHRSRSSLNRIRRASVAAVVATALARGIFVWRVEQAGNPITSIGLPRDNWTDVMQWVSRTPSDTHVLAHPGHAWKYGTSVRVSGERDVYFEEVKDLSVALYSRDVAVESLRRIRDAENFDTFTADRFRALAAEYDLDYLVIDREVDLPLMYRNERFRVYALQPDSNLK